MPLELLTNVDKDPYGLFWARLWLYRNMSFAQMEEQTKKVSETTKLIYGNYQKDPVFCVLFDADVPHIVRNMVWTTQLTSTQTEKGFYQINPDNLIEWRRTLFYAVLPRLAELTTGQRHKVTAEQLNAVQQNPMLLKDKNKKHPVWAMYEIAYRIDLLSWDAVDLLAQFQVGVWMDRHQRWVQEYNCRSWWNWLDAQPHRRMLYAEWQGKPVEEVLGAHPDEPQPGSGT